MSEHVLHCSFKGFWSYKTLVDSFLQILIVGTGREVDIVSCIDCCGSFLYGSVQAWDLVDGGIVAHDHSVKTHIVSEDILENI